MGSFYETVTSPFLAKIYIVACPLFCAALDVFNQLGVLSWPIILVSGLLASSAILVGFWLEWSRPRDTADATASNANADPGDAPTGPTQIAATPNRSVGQSILTGFILGCLIYMLYQIFLIIQVEVIQEILPTVAALQRPTVANAAQQIMFIQTQLLVAILGIVLGAVFLHRGRRAIIGFLSAAVTLIFLSMMTQLVSLAAGNRVVLDLISQYDPILVVQGYFQTVGILAGSLAVGALLPRSVGWVNAGLAKLRQA